MSEVITVNAKGLSCPQPVLETRKAISGLESGVVVVLVDTATSRNNVTRFAENKGWRVNVSELDEGGYKLTLEK
ncbi:MAG: sulfurtransferase TusA family protein [Synergistaceae bacterium]|nr:sulfurtransferase TusA family protein [Synergistaceae bacterium]